MNAPPNRHRRLGRGQPVETPLLEQLVALLLLRGSGIEPSKDLQGVVGRYRHYDILIAQQELLGLGSCKGKIGYFSDIRGMGACSVTISPFDLRTVMA